MSSNVEHRLVDVLGLPGFLIITTAGRLRTVEVHNSASGYWGCNPQKPAQVGTSERGEHVGKKIEGLGLLLAGTGAGSLGVSFGDVSTESDRLYMGHGLSPQLKQSNERLQNRRPLPPL